MSPAAESPCQLRAHDGDRTSLTVVTQPTTAVVFSNKGDVSIQVFLSQLPVLTDLIRIFISTFEFGIP